MGAHAADVRIDGDKSSAAAGSAAHKIVTARDGTNCCLVMPEQKSNPRTLTAKRLPPSFLRFRRGRDSTIVRAITISTFLARLHRRATDRRMCNSDRNLLTSERPESRIATRGGSGNVPLAFHAE